MIYKTIRSTCHTCDSITDWKAVVAFVERRNLEIVPCLECSKCGQLVPFETWHRYQQTGAVRVLS